jgi:Fe-S cluster assembly protein SufD
VTLAAALALPTRRDESWRYADLDAVARVWPAAAPEAIVIAAGQTETRHLIQAAADGAVAIHQFAVTIEAGARLDFHVLNTGGAYGRVSLDVTLRDGAHFELRGVILGSGEQVLEIVTAVTHAEPNATSNQTVRTVVGGKATGSYLGKVAVARGAQKTDAAQSVKAMLLDRTATANAKPELEIYADDVKCAHGATVGELDQAAMFYLASRGLPPAEAKQLLLQAFVAGVFEGAEDEAALTAAALSKLGAMV